jgi:predicted CXXCH cytochrome family protein
MLVKDQKSTCLRCHPKQGAEEKGAKTVHAAFGTGDCAKCHSPHKAALPKLLLAKSPDLCFSCHKALKERVAAEKTHAPIEDCGTCHQPHASSEPRLGVKAMHELCNDCHDGGDAGFLDKHLGIKAADMHCMKCHEPHSSKDPGLFKPTAHAPFSSRACDSCHVVPKK